MGNQGNKRVLGRTKSVVEGNNFLQKKGGPKGTGKAGKKKKNHRRKFICFIFLIVFLFFICLSVCVLFFMHAFFIRESRFFFRCAYFMFLCVVFLLGFYDFLFHGNKGTNCGCELEKKIKRWVG